MKYDKVFLEHSELSTDKWSLYLDTYTQIFAPFEDSSVTLLEIGVQNGGSLQIYSDFFSSDSVIIGCDIDSRVSDLNFNRGNIKTFIGSACEPSTRARILEEQSTFDFIIDDGSHDSKEIISAFRLYFPALNFGGTYIAEDLHCSYEYGYSGGLLYPRSSFEFFKMLVDVTNREHWPLGRESKWFKSKFLKRYGFSCDSEFLLDIHSIEFKNSMVMVRKKMHEQNELGQRIFSGSVSNITSLNTSFTGMKRGDFIMNRTSYLLLLKRNLKDFINRFI